MTDEPERLPAELDDDAVRRLLADARHTEPMPDDVAARLDAALADLGGDRGRSALPPPGARPSSAEPAVVSLSAHRRRRAAGLLVASAAIVVGGVVAAQHLPGSSSGSSASTAGGGRAAATDDQGPSRKAEPEAGDTAAGPRGPANGPTLRGGRVLVRSQHFTADAHAARRLVEQKAPRAAYDLSTRALDSCPGVPTGGERVAARYLGAPAVLVFHRPAGGSQVVDLYVCGSSRPVRSATLPSP